MLCSQLSSALVSSGRHGTWRSLSLISRIKDAILDGSEPTTSYRDPTEVVVIDPRAVLEGRAGEAASVALSVPAALVPALCAGSNQLGDMDDPMDEWYFGKQGEIFQYRLLGVASTQSGFVSVLTAEALAAARAGAVPLPPWEEFRQSVVSGAARFPSRSHPFLFAGHMLESAEAAVYALTENGATAGVLVSSEAAT